MNETSLPRGPFVVWFTGLSGAGKSTLSCMLAAALSDVDRLVTVLDGDVLRSSVHTDLGFSDADRRENIRRIGDLALQHVSQGEVVLVAAIAPFADARDEVRHRFAPGVYVEVFVDAPIGELRRRDTKGIYRGADNGSVHLVTGVTSPYDVPVRPDVHLRTDLGTPDECLVALLTALSDAGLVKGSAVSSTSGGREEPSPAR